MTLSWQVFVPIYDELLKLCDKIKAESVVQSDIKERFSQSTRSAEPWFFIDLAFIVV